VLVTFDLQFFADAIVKSINRWLNTGFILYIHKLSTKNGCFLISFFAIVVDKNNKQFVVFQLNKLVSCPQ